MNILVFSWRDPKHPLAGGAEQVMHEHMKGWIEEGHTVTLFSSRFNKSSKEEHLDDVHIIRKGQQLLGVQIAAFFWYLLNRKQYDFIVDQFHGLPFFTPLYTKKPKIAVVQEVARDVWLNNHLKKPLNVIVGRIGYISEPMFYWPYKKTQFLTGSNSAKQDIVKIGIKAKNIEIIEHGVILNLPKTLPKKESKKTIIFLGALAKDKGIEDAIKTFSILNKLGEYEFWIVGKGDPSYEKKIKNLVRDMNINKNTIFFGFVSNKEKFSLLAKAHLMINPSLREGWGLVNIEANSVGTPVIAYKSPGLVDSIIDDKTGIIVEENTPEKLATAIQELFSTDKLERLSKNAKDWSKNFTWEKSKKKSLLLIQKTANK